MSNSVVHSLPVSYMTKDKDFSRVRLNLFLYLSIFYLFRYSLDFITSIIYYDQVVSNIFGVIMYYLYI